MRWKDCCQATQINLKWIGLCSIIKIHCLVVTSTSFYIYILSHNSEFHAESDHQVTALQVTVESVVFVTCNTVT